MGIRGTDNMGNLGVGIGLSSVFAALGLIGGFCAVVAKHNALTPLAIGLISSTALPLIGSLGGLFLIKRAKDFEEDEYCIRKNRAMDKQL